MLGTLNWKKFRIGDLFKSENGNVDIKKEHINGKGVQVVSAGTENQGVIGFSDIGAKTHSSDTITVDMFGNTFYRDFEYKMVTHARVFSLIPMSFHMIKESGLFLVGSIQRVTQGFGYNNMCSFKKIKDLLISLPATTPPTGKCWKNFCLEVSI